MGTRTELAARYTCRFKVSTELSLFSIVFFSSSFTITSRNYSRAITMATRNQKIFPPFFFAQQNLLNVAIMIGVAIVACNWNSRQVDHIIAHCIS